MFQTWPHTENLSAVFLTDPYLIQKLDRKILATEKLDGSNMSLRIQKLPPSSGGAPVWHALCLQGRNSAIWEPEAPMQLGVSGNVIPTASYGNAAALGNLPNLIADFATKVADELGVDHLILFGEAFRVRREKAVQKCASFHPFGYYVIKPKKTEEDEASENNNDDGDQEEVKVDRKFCGLTRTTWDLFTKLSVNGPSTMLGGAALQDFLFTSGDQHIISPPPIVWEGSLYDGAPKIHSYLISAPAEVEGVFLAADDDQPYGIYCKWKTPTFDEQGNSQSKRELAAMLHAFKATGKVPGRPSLVDVMMKLDEGGPDDGIQGSGQVDSLVEQLDPRLVEVFDLCIDVLRRKAAAKAAAASAAKPKAKAPTSPALEKPHIAKLRERIRTALRREITKDAALAPGALPTDKGKLKAVADRVIKNVIVEVTDQMTADGEKVEPIAKDLQKEAGSIVLGAIMKDGLDAFREEQ